MEPTHLFELVIAMFLAIIALHYAAQRLGLPPSVGLIVGSGVIATVTPGLIGGWHQSTVLSAATRTRGSSFWTVTVFLLGYSDPTSPSNSGI